MIQRKVDKLKLFRLFDDRDIEIPFIRYGEGEPKILIVTTVHGNEVSTIYLIWRLMEYIESRGNLLGSIDILLGVNYLGILFNERYEPLSNTDINRLYPGMDGPGLASHIAKKVFDIASKGYGFVIDLHGAGNSIPHIIIDDLDSPLKDFIVDIASKSGIPYVYDYYDMDIYRRLGLDKSLPPNLIKRGIPSLTFETPSRNINDRSISVSFSGLLNILISLGVIEGSYIDIDDLPRDLSGLYRRAIYSNFTGFVEAFKKPGETFNKFEDIALIRNIYGDIMERLRVDSRGYVISIKTYGVVPAYGWVASVGVVR